MLPSIITTAAAVWTRKISCTKSQLLIMASFTLISGVYLRHHHCPRSALRRPSTLVHSLLDMRHLHTVSIQPEVKVGLLAFFGSSAMMPEGTQTLTNFAVQSAKVVIAFACLLGAVLLGSFIYVACNWRRITGELNRIRANHLKRSTVPGMFCCQVLLFYTRHQPVCLPSIRHS